MSLVRIVTGGEAIVRKTGGKRYIFKPVLTNAEQPVSPVVAEEPVSLTEALEKVLDLSKTVEPIATDNNVITDIIDSVNGETSTFGTELENTINREWSKP